MLSAKMEINRVMGQRMKRGGDMKRASKWLQGREGDIGGCLR